MWKYVMCYKALASSNTGVFKMGFLEDLQGSVNHYVMTKFYKIKL